MKGVGMLFGNFELNPLRRPIRAWPKLFLTPKETIFKHRQMRKLGLYEWSFFLIENIHIKYIFLYFFACNPKRDFHG